ncbi:MAG: HAMP domain-containing protein [Treponema sp.]|nr:HAMP domain-containing protein [Treponema sp.]
MKQKRVRNKAVKFPIGLKLVLIFAVMVIFALGATTLMVSQLFTSDVGIRANDNNMEINRQTSGTVQNVFLNVQSDTNSLLNFLLLLQEDEDYDIKVNALFEDLCNHNPEIQFMYSTSLGYRFSEEFLLANGDIEEDFNKWLVKDNQIEKSAMEGSVEIKNISNLFDDVLMYCIAFSHRNPISQKDDFVCVAFNPEKSASKLIEACTGNVNSSFVVNKYGETLISDDMELMKTGKKVSDSILVKKAMENATIEGKQMEITDDNEVIWLCASRVIAGDMVVVTRIEKSIVYESIFHSTLRTLLVSMAVFFLTILIIRFFSITLSNPIEDLVAATKEIDAGNYEIKLKPRTKDEIGVLTDSFMSMTGGLQQRQRLMSSFSKFTNRVIAEKAANGELTMGGESKNATVFFSDIRSFTAMSEKMTPEQVVDFLNDYFTRMVDCVNKTNGIVDKFIGDAVMAVWGAATTNGNPAADAWAAVKAALMMRIALYHFNQNQIKNGRNPIKIGCGINSGPIVAGQIGSEDHMNYTVIGDTVNLASRTEALNKPFATDILITENTYKLVKDKIIVEEMPGVHVKGKEEAIKMYAVINAVGVKGPEDIHALRKFLGWDEPQDISKVNTDEEEKKYKISGK